MLFADFVISWLVLCASSACAKSWSKGKDAVLLSKVRTLTVHGDQQTSHRRVSSIPQLQCVGGDARGLYAVDVMRCKNSGSEYDAEDVQWTCQAELPPEFKLGGTQVVCEGYDSPDDPYILKGSCGVEYRLVLTDSGTEKYGRRSGMGSSFGMSDGLDGLSKMLAPVWNILFWAIFIVVAGVLLYSICGNVGGPGPNRVRRGGGGGDGGGFDDGAPPPYSPYPPRRKQKPSASSWASNSQSSSSGAGPWRPGFWTGAATGAAAGYYMGNRNGSSSSREPSRGFVGGGGPSAGPSSSPSAGPSSSRYTSTGFGGTSRR